MPYSFPCPKCKRVFTRTYKPGDTLKCTYGNCGHKFPTPTGSFLTKSLDEQQAEVKPRLVTPKALRKFDLSNYLFSDDEDEDEESDEEKNSSEKEPTTKTRSTIKLTKEYAKKIDLFEDRPKLSSTRYERQYKRKKQLIEDGISASVVHDDERVHDVALLEDPYSLHFSSEDEEDQKSIERAKERSPAEDSSKKTRASKKVNEKEKVQGNSVLPTFSDDDGSAYELEENEDEEEEEDKFGSPVFSDMEEDSEVEDKGPKEYPSKRYSSISSILTEGQDGYNSMQSNTIKTSHKRKREVYMAGGESTVQSLDENGNEIVKDIQIYRTYAPKIANKFNPYIIFNRLERGKIKELHPDLNNQELSIEVGRRYNLLSEEEKQKYIDHGKKELDNFKAQHKLKDDPKLPRLPPSGFVLFKSRIPQEVIREWKNADKKYSYAKKTSELWKSLPKEERASYIEEGRRMKEEFIKNNPEAYKQKMETMVKKSLAKKLQKVRDHYALKR